MQLRIPSSRHQRSFQSCVGFCPSFCSPPFPSFPRSSGSSPIEGTSSRSLGSGALPAVLRCGLLQLSPLVIVLCPPVFTLLGVSQDTRHGLATQSSLGSGTSHSLHESGMRQNRKVHSLCGTCGMIPRWRWNIFDFLLVFLQLSQQPTSPTKSQTLRHCSQIWPRRSADRHFDGSPRPMSMVCCCR